MFNGRTLLRALLGAALLTSLTLAPVAQADGPFNTSKPCATTAPPPGPSATKILVAGDSIVHESRGDWTWRYFLWHQLHEAGEDVDFVGDQNWMIEPNKADWAYCDYQQPDFDLDYTACPGRWLADFNKPQPQLGVPCVPNTGAANWINYEMSTHTPNVVVLVAGANDLARNVSAADTLQQAQAFVTNARAVNPNVKLVLATAPTGGPYDKYQTAQYNNLLTAAAPTWSTPASPVVVAQVMSNWGTATHTWDGIHPNVIGEQVLASGIADALHELGIGEPGRPVDPAYKLGLRAPVPNFSAALDGSTLQLSWSLPAGASGVQVVARRTTGGDIREWTVLKDVWWRPYDNAVGCTNPQYNVITDPRQTIPCLQTSITSGLVSGHSYDVALHAAKGTPGGAGGGNANVAVDVFSEIRSITMPGEIPTPPAVPVVQAPVAGVNAVSLTWAAVSGATYDVRWRPDGGGTYASTAVTGTSRVVADLLPGQAYGFQVRASKNGDRSDWSAEQLATPIPAVPVVTATAGVNAATVSWPAVAGAGSYNLRWRVGSGVFTTQVVNGTSTTFSGLTPGASHGFSVQAVANATTSAWSAEKVATPIPATPVVSEAMAGIHAATLSWGDVPGASGYSVAWRVGTGGWSTSSVATPTNRTISGLVAGVRYEVKVKALAGGTSSGWSASKFVTAKANAISALAKPVLTTVAGPKVKVTWRKATGATRYLLQFHQVGQPWRNVGWFTTPAATSAKLKKKKSYEWRVIPYDGYVAGKVSPTARIKVK